MLTEKDFEDIICRYPDLLEDGLVFKGRQINLYGRRMDVLFEDKFKRKLIIELKSGPIKDEHIGQVLSYEGMMLSADDPTIRVMLVGNRVPPNIQRSLDHHGIAWKEIGLITLKNFLREKNDVEFLPLFGDVDVDISKKILPVMQADPISVSPSGRPRSKYYEMASNKKNNPKTRTFEINELLKQGKIQEGRIDFTKLSGFGHYLGNTERSVLEFDGNFILTDIVYKEGNKKLIKEATLKKVITDLSEQRNAAVFTKEAAKRSISNLVGYLKQNLVKVDLERENRSKGYRFISIFFDDFKNSKAEIKVAASMISSNNKSEDHFGPCTKGEMEATAEVFGYDVHFIPKKRAEIPTINPSGSRKYFTEAIFRKK